METHESDDGEDDGYNDDGEDGRDDEYDVVDVEEVDDNCTVSDVDTDEIDEIDDDDEDDDGTEETVFVRGDGMVCGMDGEIRVILGVPLLLEEYANVLVIEIEPPEGVGTVVLTLETYVVDGG
eukprot:TRINITY_DN17035_c0_g1::TRINITY_DN17035_c0_g1_i1::g.20948::m.20948 TRINITY_DN17035_c0_g1::TRINITY_DN17035_c0_g1_i1::g.20948  ORF type:complete len:123 (+),score=24.45 TRINITY_DN17035_c0_g1_i1:97-465(+)